MIENLESSCLSFSEVVCEKKSLITIPLFVFIMNSVSLQSLYNSRINMNFNPSSDLNKQFGFKLTTNTFLICI